MSATKNGKLMCERFPRCLITKSVCKVEKQVQGRRRGGCEFNVVKKMVLRGKTSKTRDLFH